MKIPTFFLVVVLIKKGRSLTRRLHRKLGGKAQTTYPGSLPKTLPKIIWIYWDKGEDAAPALVRAAIESWRSKNPRWDVRVLNAQTVGSIASLQQTPDALPPQAFTDLARLRLLRDNGGVWVDATLYCLRPLDDWLPVLVRHGFFCFTWTESDRWLLWPNVMREMTNWFIAALPRNELLSAWDARSQRYWEGRTTAEIYYWPHVLLEMMSLTNRSVRKRIRRMPRIGAFGPHIVHDYIENARDYDRTRDALSTGAAPIQKLRWSWSEDDANRALALLRAL